MREKTMSYLVGRSKSQSHSDSSHDFRDCHECHDILGALYAWRIVAWVTDTIFGEE